MFNTKYFDRWPKVVWRCYSAEVPCVSNKSYINCAAESPIPDPWLAAGCSSHCITLSTAHAPLYLCCSLVFLRCGEDERYAVSDIMLNTVTETLFIPILWADDGLSAVTHHRIILIMFTHAVTRWSHWQLRVIILNLQDDISPLRISVLQTK